MQRNHTQNNRTSALQHCRIPDAHFRQPGKTRRSDELMPQCLSSHWVDKWQGHLRELTLVNCEGSLGAREKRLLGWEQQQLRHEWRSSWGASASIEERALGLWWRCSNDRPQAPKEAQLQKMTHQSCQSPVHNKPITQASEILLYTTYKPSVLSWTEDHCIRIWSTDVLSAKPMNILF